MSKNTSKQPTASTNVDDLIALAAALPQIEKAENPRMNIFRSMGLVSQETHHSSLFAGLLSPETPHRLGNFFLKKFLDGLYDYQTKPDDATQNILSNIEILKKQGICSKAELLALVCGYVNVGKEVKTTVKITGQSGRMDIFIEIPESKTAIVIENKTNSTTHDNQLRKYQKDVDFRYDQTWKKLFVYLSPKGELPYDRVGKKTKNYNADWCVFDYVQICRLLEETIAEVSKNSKAFHMDSQDKQILIYGLKGYLDMCNTDILNENVAKFNKCKEIIDANKSAVKKLLQYLASPTIENVVGFCAEKLNGGRMETEGIISTTAMREVFEKNGEAYLYGKLHILVVKRGNKNFNGYSICAEIENTRNPDPYDHKWTPMQQRIIDEISRRLKKPLKSPKSNRIISEVTLLDSEDCYKSMEDVAQKLEINLNKFIAQLNEIEDILRSLTPSTPAQP